MKNPVFLDGHSHSCVSLRNMLRGFIYRTPVDNTTTILYTVFVGLPALTVPISCSGASTKSPLRLVEGSILSFVYARFTRSPTYVNRDAPIESKVSKHQKAIKKSSPFVLASPHDRHMEHRDVRGAT